MKTPIPPLRLAAALLALAFAPRLSATINYYVSPTGNDANSGTSPGAAFKSITTAQQAVRARIAEGMTDHVHVNLRDGEYPVTTALEFNNADSGRDGYRVTWQSYLNEKPVLTGGQTVSNWLDAGGGLYRINGTVTGRTAGTKMRNFWFNGERRPWSSAGPVTGSGWHRDAFEKPIGIIVSTTSVPAAPANPRNIELSWKIEWMHHRLPVESVGPGTAAGTSILYLKQGPLDRALAQSKADLYWPSYDKPFMIENCWEKRTAGQWYHSPASGFLFYQLKTGESIANAAAVYPVLSGPFIKIKGSSAASPVANLTFRGLTFRYSDLHHANSKGVLNIQAGKWLDPADALAGYDEIGYQPEGALQVENARDLVIDQNTFEHLGTAGVVFKTAITRSEITGNTFKDLSQSAISLGHWRDEYAGSAAARMTFITVKNNTIDTVGREYKGAPGICGYFLQNSEIVNNEVKNVPYTAISVGWGWERAVAVDNRSRQNSIAHNRVENCMTELQDGGAIYVLGLQKDSATGSEIFGNYLKGVIGRYAAIYPDQGSTHWWVSNNAIEAVNHHWFMAWNGSIRDITAQQNWSTKESYRTLSGTKDPENKDILMNYPRSQSEYLYDASANSYYNPTTRVWIDDAVLSLPPSWPADALNVTANSGAAKNLALTGTASASSYYQNMAMFDASRAKDGSTQSIWSAGNAVGTLKEYWQLDLGRRCRISHIEVVARQDLDQAVTRKKLEIWVSDDPEFPTSTSHRLGTVDASGRYTLRDTSHSFDHQTTWRVESDTDVPYRFVRLTKSEAEEYITAAEVRVFGW